jgi:hypothetical protein
MFVEESWNEWRVREARGSGVRRRHEAVVRSGSATQCEVAASPWRVTQPLRRGDLALTQPLSWFRVSGNRLPAS